jgi:LAO/AO transport system kinase
MGETIERLLRDRAENGRISCAKARALAGELGVSFGEVGAAADAIGIRITNCELGCF